MSEAVRDRLNLSISTRSKNRLDRLSKITDASGYAEVIRQSLLVYEAVVNRLSNGETFFIQKEGETPRPIDFMIDVNHEHKKVASPS